MKPFDEFSKQAQKDTISLKVRRIVASFFFLFFFFLGGGGGWGHFFFVPCFRFRFQEAFPMGVAAGGFPPKPARCCCAAGGAAAQGGAAPGAPGAVRPLAWGRREDISSGWTHFDLDHDPDVGVHTI